VLVYLIYADLNDIIIWIL